MNSSMNPGRPKRSTWGSYLAVVGMVALATGAGLWGQNHLAPPDFVMLYLLVIVTAAARFGRGPSLLSSSLSVLAYDFFFVLPVGTFFVAHERHLLTFVSMFLVGLFTSALMSRVRRHEQEAVEREGRTDALYSLSRGLGSAVDEEQVARVTADHALETFGGGAWVLLTDAQGAPVTRAGAGGEREQLSVATAVTSFPLKAGVDSCGTLVLESASVSQAGQRQLAEAFAAQAALAIGRARLTLAARSAELRARTEEMRSSLLSAVSHDLRTPLGAITGAATALRDAPAEMDATQRTELADTICVEADRLERFVVNLLEMTKLEAGALEVQREWFPLEEVVGSALTRLEAGLNGRSIRVSLPPDLPLVPADPVLLEQVFYNLLENATKHTPSDTPLEISARVAAGQLLVEVADRGPGLPNGSESLVFDKFFRGASTGVRGVGLGLAICRGIISAHGGDITAGNREGGGAAFTVALPLIGDVPMVPSERELLPLEEKV